MKNLINNKEKYFEDMQYFEYLENQGLQVYKKYIDSIKKFTKGEKRFLDVGCGAGNTLEALRKTDIKGQGLDISLRSIQFCKKKKLNCKLYSGSTFPFTDEMFDCVGSFDVLEHVEDPDLFLRENLRILKKGGILIIACPNFLSISNNYHVHTKGAFRKLLNLTQSLKIGISKKAIFEKMIPVERKPFMPDDDAVNVTNPLVLKLWGKQNKLKELYWSSQLVYRKGFLNLADNFFLKLFLGGCFFIFEKKDD